MASFKDFIITFSILLTVALGFSAFVVSTALSMDYFLENTECLLHGSVVKVGSCSKNGKCAVAVIIAEEEIYRMSSQLPMVGDIICVRGLTRWEMLLK